jgi:hypothetical protein
VEREREDVVSCVEPRPRRQQLPYRALPPQAPRCCAQDRAGELPAVPTAPARVRARGASDSAQGQNRSRRSGCRLGGLHWQQVRPQWKSRSQRLGWLGSALGRACRQAPSGQDHVGMRSNQLPGQVEESLGRSESRFDLEGSALDEALPGEFLQRSGRYGETRLKVVRSPTPPADTSWSALAHSPWR